MKLTLHSLTGKKKELSRKELRKNMRKIKKLKKQEFFLKKKKEKVVENSVKVVAVKSAQVSSDQTAKTPNIKSKVKPVEKTKSQLLQEQLKKDKLKRDQVQQRKKQLIIANRKEEKEIKRIEKQLKFNKRKSKSIPKCLVDDELDYLLEMCDPDRRSQIVKEEFDYADNDLGFEEDLACVTSKDAPEELVNPKSKKSTQKTKKSVKIVEDEKDEIVEEDEDMDDMMEDEDMDDMDEGEDIDDLGDMDEENEDLEEGDEEYEGLEEGVEENEDLEELDEENDDLEGDEENEELENEEDSEESVNGDDSLSDKDSSKNKAHNTDVKNARDNDHWEDIYGRTRDKAGNVVTGTYIPPAKRQLDSSKSAEMEKLKRTMKGLLNRLAESNLPGIVSSIESLYLSNSRHNMQQVMNQLITDSLVAPVLSPERLIMEHCVLIAALHANVGTEVGAQFLEAMVRKFDALFSTVDEELKEVDNLILIIAHLYNFGVVAASLLTDILSRLTQRFSEKDIELILLVLRSVGFSLRKEDPVALKEIIVTLQSKATQVVDQSNRTRFMIDTLMAIRNNNMNKIPNYDASHTEHLKKILRNSLIRKGVSLSKMNVSYQELIAADKIGRWWVVGSAWVGKGPVNVAPRDETDVESGSGEKQYSAELLEMARKQRMNTDVRRNIFCILMTAEDYLESFEHLLRLGLKPQQEREIIHVAIDCCLHEKQYNPYYALLVQKFCASHRRFQIATQFALWDRFQELNVLSALQTAHLAKLIVYVVAEQGLTLAVLKSIQFTEMDRTLVRFLRHVLLGLLLHQSDMSVQAAFTKIATQSKLRLLKEGLTLFMHHFVMKNVEKMDPDQAKKLQERIDMVQSILSAV